MQPCLNRGRTFAVLRASGNTLDFSVPFIILVKGSSIYGAGNLIRLAGMRSSPIAFCWFTAIKTCDMIILLSIGSKVKLSWVDSDNGASGINVESIKALARL